MPFARGAIAVLLALGSLLMAPASDAAATLGCSVAKVPARVVARTRLDDKVLALVNARREALGLAAVKVDKALQRSANWKARDMASRRYFAHGDPRRGTIPGRTALARFHACGYPKKSSMAENLAAGQGTATSVFNAMVGSAEHRANIDNPKLRYVGIGVAYSASSPDGTYWTLELGSKAS